jgi:hypothetical protein
MAKKFRVALALVTAAMIALPELAMPVAAMPLAQPGAMPAIQDMSLAGKVETVAFKKRKFKRGGYGRYGGNRYWKGKRYGYNKRWKGNRYGWNKRWRGNRYGWNNGWCRYGRCGYGYYNGWNNPWPWIAAGAAIGYAGSYYYNDDYDDGAYYGGGNAHVQWCLNRYRSYDPSTDTYMGYDGYRHRCRAPY